MTSSGGAAKVGPVGKVGYIVIRNVVDLFDRIFWRLRVRGGHHVPTSGAVILAPIHRSNIDTLLVPMTTRRHVRFMAKDSMFKNPAAAKFFGSLGVFPVTRGTADREALRKCIEVLKAGHPLVVYPEGGRRDGPVVAELFEGVAHLACKTGAPIVPIGIGGSDRAMPKGAKLFRPVRTTVVVGRPLHPPVVVSGKSVPRKAARTLTVDLWDALQDVFDEARRDVGDPVASAEERAIGREHATGPRSGAEGDPTEGDSE
jgi:1-acyl-sn-glycerol-3-phosphate acyltransferase